jgi:translin
MDRAGELEAIGRAARDVLESQHAAREVMLRCARQVIQAAGRAVRAVHRHDFAQALAELDAAETLLAEARDAAEAHPDLRHGAFGDAAKEYAEARLTLAIVRDEPLPGPTDLGVEVAPYLNGLAEAASELRRHLLDCLRSGRLERAEQLLGVMDEVLGLCMTVDYPDALTGGLRRTTDALRAVVERSRGDLTTALTMSRVRDAITAAVPADPESSAG